MKKDRELTRIHEYEEEPDDLELPDWGSQDRKLILKMQPPPRKGQLIAHGVREIRCTCCVRIKSIEDAEESEEGWICGDCLSEGVQELKFGGQRGR
jgi:hypothetical protein